MYKKMPKTTHLFTKCLEYQYAKAFIDEGAIRFAMPSEWKPDGTSKVGSEGAGALSGICVIG